MLNWGFYWDKWLIDPLPATFQIDVKENTDPDNFTGKYMTSPASIECYFGANPEYIYGEGKLQHEVYLSPSGVIVEGSYNDIINDNFINLESVTIRESDAVDFFGKSNNAKHFGEVNTVRYIEDIQKSLYKLEEGGYFNKNTINPRLRKATVEELTDSAVNPLDYQIYESISAMKSDGAEHYTDLNMVIGEAYLKDQMGNLSLSSSQISIVSEYPVQYVRDGLLRYISLSRTYLSLGCWSMWLNYDFSVLFRTSALFQGGTVFSFGSYGGMDAYSLTIDRDSVTILENGRSHTFIAIVDWEQKQPVHFYVIGSTLRLQIGNLLIATIEMIADRVASRTNIYIGANRDKSGPSGISSISEFAVFSKTPNRDVLDEFFSGDKQFLRSPSIPSYQTLNVKPIFPNELTYDDDNLFFIPNYMGQQIFKIYIKDSGDETTVITRAPAEEYHDSDVIVVTNKSFNMPDNNRAYGMFSDDDLDERMIVLTKLTSDTHSPLKIVAPIEVPDWFEKGRKLMFNMNVRAIDKFITYTYKKYRDEE